VLSSYILALLLPPALLLAWVGVQHLWRREFGSPQGDVDVLAGRSDCGNCGCAKPCERDEAQTEFKRGDPDHETRRLQ
jgi:hypothetical protein